MRHQSTRHPSHLVSGLAGLGGVALVACVLLPIARLGVGSATPMRGLSDLILAGALRRHVPQWAGLFGYLPAIAGTLVLLSEPLGPRPRRWFRATGIALAAVSIGALVWLVPWSSPSDLGPGLQVGTAGLALCLAAAIADVVGRPTHRARSQHHRSSTASLPTASPPTTQPKGHPDVLSTVRH